MSGSRLCLVSGFRVSLALGLLMLLGISVLSLGFRFGCSGFTFEV